MHVERQQPPLYPLYYDSCQLATACRDLGLTLVVLYGSRATGTPPPTPASDLDLAVGGPCPSWEHLMTWYRTLSAVFADYDVDLVSLSAADPLFRYEIFRGGRLLCGSLDDFLAYKAYAYRDFMDSADLRQLEEALFRKKMAFIRQELYATP